MNPTLWAVQITVGILITECGLVVATRKSSTPVAAALVLFVTATFAYAAVTLGLPA